MRTRLAIAAALLSVAASASASVYSFSLPVLPDLPFVDDGQVSGPAFSDDWRFAAPALAGSASGSVISVDIAQFFNIDDIQLALYDAADQALAIGTPGNGSALSNVTVTAGADYYFRVTGRVTGTAGGFYVFSAVASPLSEPGALLLALVGLGITLLMRMSRLR